MKEDLIHPLMNSQLITDHFSSPNFKLPQKLVQSFFEKICVEKVSKNYTFFLLKNGIKPRNTKTFLEENGYAIHGNKTLCLDGSVVKSVQATVYVYCRGEQGIYFYFFCKDKDQFERLKLENKITLHKKDYSSRSVSNVFFKSKRNKRLEVDFTALENLGIC